MSKHDELHGWWRLTSFYMETQGTTERQQPGGARPFGRLVLSPNGQMIAALFSEGRKAGQSDADHLALFRSMVAYTGFYRVEDDKFVTTVDGSWNEEWTGTDQERFYKLDGDRLDIIAAWGPHPFNPTSPPIRGILSWQRET